MNTTLRHPDRTLDQVPTGSRPADGRTPGPERASDYSFEASLRVSTPSSPPRGVDRPLLVGRSYGAMIAVHWAARHPDRTRGAVSGDGALPHEWLDDADREQIHTQHPRRPSSRLRPHHGSHPLRVASGGNLGGNPKLMEKIRANSARSSPATRTSVSAPGSRATTPRSCARIRRRRRRGPRTHRRSRHRAVRPVAHASETKERPDRSEPVEALPRRSEAVKPPRVL
ncbi:alpha/beta fold hydrolase [Streptomyces sp. CA-294286]|uniref:alpha/beta fold hydrolase n=1 Tax=Streptomyces sp. CA-294286 TaxID=3240070 RepID=UPI003D9087A0